MSPGRNISPGMYISSGRYISPGRYILPGTYISPEVSFSRSDTNWSLISPFTTLNITNRPDSFPSKSLRIISCSASALRSFSPDSPLSFLAFLKCNSTVPLFLPLANNISETEETPKAIEAAPIINSRLFIRFLL